LIHKSFVNR